MDKNSVFFSQLPSELNVDSPVEERLLAEYGAMFVARGVNLPDRIVFRNDADVSEFQSKVRRSSEIIDGVEIELQAAALEDLRNALLVAEGLGLSITPRGRDSARRTYSETVELWKSRVEPGLSHWLAEGKLTEAEADRIRSLSPFEQVSVVLELEENGLYFAKDLSKSIIYSVAPPGTSQHLSMLALDVAEFDDKDVRALLIEHKWFQTVVSDLPHFTYLGVREDELADLGLKKVLSCGRTFWLPDV